MTTETKSNVIQQNNDKKQKIANLGSDMSIAGLTLGEALVKQGLTVEDDIDGVAVVQGDNEDPCMFIHKDVLDTRIMDLLGEEKESKGYLINLEYRDNDLLLVQTYYGLWWNHHMCVLESRGEQGVKH